MIDFEKFDESNANVVLEELEKNILSKDSNTTPELLSMFCWCVGAGMLISEASKDAIMTRFENYTLTEFVKLLADLSMLECMPDGRKHVLCSELLGPENASNYAISIAVCALLASRLSNKLSFIHGFITRHGSPFVDEKNLQKLSVVSEMFAKHTIFLKEDCSLCVLKASRLIRRIHKFGLSHIQAFKAIELLLLAISVFCPFTFTSDFQDILYDIECIIKGRELSEDQMMCVLEILMACLSKQYVFWRSVCNTAFSHLAQHSKDHLDAIIAHIFETLNKDNSFIDVEEDEVSTSENAQHPSLLKDASDDGSVCSEDMDEIEKRIGEYIRLQKNTELAETKRKSATRDMQFKLFDWLEILSNTMEYSNQARVIMARHIIKYTNKHMNERIGKFVNECYRDSFKKRGCTSVDPLEFQQAIDSFFDTLNNSKHIFHNTCDKIIAFLLKISSQISKACHDTVVLHAQRLWIDFVTRKGSKNCVHLFTSILQNHTLAAKVIFSATIDESLTRKFSPHEARFVLLHAHRIIKQISEPYKNNCLKLMAHASDSLAHLMDKGNKKRKLRPEIRKSIQLVSNFGGAQRNVPI